MLLQSISESNVIRNISNTFCTRRKNAFLVTYKTTHRRWRDCQKELHDALYDPGKCQALGQPFLTTFAILLLNVTFSVQSVVNVVLNLGIIIM